MQVAEDLVPLAAQWEVGGGYGRRDCLKTELAPIEDGLDQVLIDVKPILQQRPSRAAPLP